MITIMMIRPAQFHPSSSLHADVFESVCSKECGVGEFKVTIIIMMMIVIMIMMIIMIFMIVIIMIMMIFDIWGIAVVDSVWWDTVVNILCHPVFKEITILEI